MLCDGANYSATQYPDLAGALLGLLSRGSDVTVPDLRGRSVVGQGRERPFGATGGVESVTLTPGQVGHNHTLMASMSDASTSFPGEAVFAQALSLDGNFPYCASAGNVV